MNRPAFTTPLLLSFPSTSNHAATTPIYMQTSSNARRPTNRRSQSSSRRFRQRNDRQQNQIRSQQRREKRNEDIFDEDGDIGEYEDEDVDVDEENDLKPYDAALSRNAKSRTLPTSRTTSDKKNISDSKSNYHAENEEFDIETTDDHDDDQSGDFYGVASSEPNANDQLADDLTLYDDSIDDGFFARYRKQSSPHERKAENPTLSNSATTKKPSRANQEAASSAFDAVDRLFDTFKFDKKPPSSASTSNRGSLLPGTAARHSNSQRRNRSDRSISQNGGSQLDRKTWLENVKARAATTSARRKSQEALPQKKGNSDIDEKAVDVEVVEDVSSTFDTFEQSEEPKGKSTGALDKVQGDENSTKGLDIEEDGDALINEREIDGTVHEVEVNHSQRRGSGLVRKPESSADDSRRRRQHRDQTEELDLEKSNATNFRASAFQTLMQIARQGPVGDPTLGARRKLGRNVRNTGPPTSGKGRGAGAISALTSDSLLSEGNNEKEMSNRSTDRARTESGEVNSGDVSQKLNRIISGQSGRDQSASSAHEPIDDEMEREIDVKRLETREMRRQRFSSVRRTLGQTRRVVSVPKEWQPITEEDVSKVVSDGRPLRPFSHRGKQAPGIVSDCAECNGSGLETCAVCLGEGWIAPLHSFDGQKDVDADRLRLLDEIWTTPNLVVNTRGEAQCIRCNSIGKQLCHDCKGSGSSLHKGFSLSDKYKEFDLFGGSEDGPPDLDVDFEQSNEDEEEDEDVEVEDEDEDDDLDMFQLFQGSAETLGVFKKRAVRKGVDVASALNNEVDDESGNEDGVYPLQDESEELLATLEAMHIADLEDRVPSLDRRLGIRSKPLRSRVTDIDEDEDDVSALDDDYDEDDDTGDLVDEDDDTGDLVDEEDDGDIAAMVRKATLRGKDEDDDMDDVSDLQDDDDFEEVVIDDEDDEGDSGLTTREA